MGTWGSGSFENDDALDWIAELESYTNDGPIINALNTVIDQADDHLEETDCSVEIAAAAVVAALMGNPHEDCPEEIETWVESRTAPTATRIAQARQATEVVRDDSALKDLWKASNDFETWQASVEDLLSRLPY